MKQIYPSYPAGPQDTIVRFIVGDQVETNQEYRVVVQDLNARYKHLSYPEYLRGQIIDIVSMPMSGSYHVFLDSWQLPIGIRYIQKAKKK